MDDYNRFWKRQTVARYDLTTDHDGIVQGSMQQTSFGDWVTSDDFQAMVLDQEAAYECLASDYAGARADAYGYKITLSAAIALLREAAPWLSNYRVLQAKMEDFLEKEDKWNKLTAK